MSATTTIEFPASAPLLRRDAAPVKYRPVLLDKYLFPAICDSVATLLDIEAGFISGSVVAARWERSAFRPDGAWAIARLSIHVDADEHAAYLIQPLETALEWGAIGVRRPAGARQPASPEADGSLRFSEAQSSDLLGYYEVCNVIACSVLAREWRTQLARPLYILLRDVLHVSGRRLPAELDAPDLATVQGIIGYSERRLPPKHGQPQYQRLAPLQLTLAEELAVDLLWQSKDGSERRKTDALLATGRWRGRS